MLSKLRVKLLESIYKRALKNKSFSVISNNCWAGIMYGHLGLPYNTPFVGLFIMAPDYVKLLKNLDVIYADFKFIKYFESKYVDYLEKKNYPIGVLPGNIEIHFLHYKSEEEALVKWKRRLKRLNMQNLIIKNCEQNLCTSDIIREFDKLPFKNKVCFTNHNYPEFKSCVWLREQSKLPYVQNCWLISNKYWNLIKKANSIQGYKIGFLSKIGLFIADRLLAYESKFANFKL